MSCINIYDSVAQRGFGVGPINPTNAPNRSVQCTLLGTGAVAADFVVEYSNDQEAWFPHDGSPVHVTGDATNSPVSVMLPFINQASGFIRVTVQNPTGEIEQALATMAWM